MTPPRASARAITPTLLCALLLGIGAPLGAQSMEDGLMPPKHGAMLGLLYVHDSWDEYWEGTLKRTNGNIGTLTTQSTMAIASYGVTSRLAVMASLPYVWTHASQGVLEGMHGLQDVTVALKYRLFATDTVGQRGLRGFAVLSGALPASHYTPDFMPMSIGTGGSRTGARLTLGYQGKSPWFAAASGAYVFCNNVHLDRNSYFTDGQLYNTNAVAMPNVAEYAFSAGYRHGRWSVPLSIVQHTTLGGGDIRRQDMPFVSDRMNFTRVGADAMYALPIPGSLSLIAGASYVVAGRNVGQSTTLTTGVVHAFHF